MEKRITQVKYFKLTPVDANDPTFKAASSYHNDLIIKAEDEIHARDIADTNFAIGYDNPDIITGVWKNRRYVIADELTHDEYIKYKGLTHVIEE